MRTPDLIHSSSSSPEIVPILYDTWDVWDLRVRESILFFSYFYSITHLLSWTLLCLSRTSLPLVLSFPVLKSLFRVWGLGHQLRRCSNLSRTPTVLRQRGDWEHIRSSFMGVPDQYGRSARKMIGSARATPPAFGRV